jgi:hypothetical protein
MSKELPPNTDNQKKIGMTLIFIGIAGLITTGILSLFVVPIVTMDGSIPAISVFLLMLGMVFYFPDLLEDQNGGISTMRVVVLMTISIFVITTVKLSWTVSSLLEFRIDKSWIYILGLAFGAKAVQRFAEEPEDQTKTKP